VDDPIAASPRSRPQLPRIKEEIMAKSQKKSNREIRKPKAEKPKKQNASNPTQKPGGVSIVTLKS